MQKLIIAIYFQTFMRNVEVVGEVTRHPSDLRQPHHPQICRTRILDQEYDPTIKHNYCNFQNTIDILILLLPLRDM